MSSNCFKKRDDVIEKYAQSNNIDYFRFNNRASDLVRYAKKIIDGKESKITVGTTYEDVEESYYDICGAINLMENLGYEKIYLQGHSLGCTKIVYTYNKLKKEENEKILSKISAIILLSMADIPKTFKVYLSNKFENYVKFAEEKMNFGNNEDIMPKDVFIHPISVKTFYRYTKQNKDIDFAKFSEKEYDFKEINNIDVPLFMRWGNVNEVIEQDAKDLVEFMNQKIITPIKDIDFIDGADHGYTNKEEILAKQILLFLNKERSS